MVRPRLLPLLRRRLEIAEIRLDTPAVTLLRNDKGEWNFERLAARAATSAAPGSAGAGPPIPLPAPSSLDVVVPRFALNRGTLVVAREDRETLVGAEGIELGTSLSRVGGALTGAGQLKVASMRIANRLDVRELTAPPASRRRRAHSRAPARPAGRRHARRPGDRPLRGAGALRDHLDLRDARAESLLAALGGWNLSGRLRAEARLTGTAEGTTGEGRAEIRDGQLVDFRCWAPSPPR